MKRVRCAIYTRKSSEEGLDQDFNSLDAQREACEAYIASQKHEGWIALPKYYDDGGISGGTLERPALQRLLRAVDDGMVDQIVVYKIDRLTRALMDFTKLIERLDASSASFVSVTQSFNTATSMGRLTLNMLLSFAQFEREVTAERIWDKIAASKKKGMWMGGPVPLGYRTQDRHLIVDGKEAETVRLIFDLYEKHSSVRAAKQQADHLQLTSRYWTTKSGELRGGKPYTRGHLYRILTNPIYAGRVGHKGKTYDGKHTGLIEPDRWDNVQVRLSQASAKPRRRGRPRIGEEVGNKMTSNSGAGGQLSRAPSSTVRSSPLAGKLYDETGDRLTPSHANKKGRRYRYYVSNRLIKHAGEKQETIGGWRLPAKQLEATVSTIMLDWLRDDRRSLDLIVGSNPATELTQHLCAKIKSLTGQMEGSQNPVEQLAQIIDRVTIGNGEIIVRLNRTNLLEMLGIKIPAARQNGTEPISIRTPFDHRKRGVESELILGLNRQAQPDPVLITNIAKARSWLKDIQAGKSVSAIANEQNRSIRQIQRHLELAFLSRKIVQQITEGTQPPELTSRQLLHTPIPIDWDQQHILFGIS